MSFRMTQPVFTFDKLLQRLQLGKKAPPLCHLAWERFIRHTRQPCKDRPPLSVSLLGWRNAIGHQPATLPFQS